MEIPNEEHKKKKRKRTVIHQAQLHKLEELFNVENWPNRARKEKLAKELNRSIEFVNIWFQNKRARVKRDTEERAELLARQKILDKINEKSTVAQELVYRDRTRSIFKFCITPPAPNQQVSTKLVGINIKAEEPESQSTSETNDQIKIDVDNKDEPTNADIETTDLQEKDTTETDANEDVDTNEAQDKSEEGFSNMITIASPHNSMYQLPSLIGGSTAQESQVPTLFRSIINMIAVAEGGIMSPAHPEFDTAVTSALYGIKIGKSSRLIYDKVFGLDIEEFDDHAENDN
ncbi:unnamed protein product [Owenia fusiformis]|uniref:Uncharacterized protein n=1 Tax=Owenia fusiformis TaxID=6347 RepID=A0A8J1U6N6_OWEFU|nr:unnamed protein product [Owenia fusiformis]